MGDDKKERGRPRVKTTPVNSNVLETDLNELIKKAILKIENLTKIVEFNAKSCEESFKAFEFTQGKVKDKLNSFVEEFENIRDENKDLKKENSKLKKTVSGLVMKVNSFDQKFEMMERESRKSNLCVDGVLERNGLNLLKLVNDLFRDLDINLNAEEVSHSIFRKGTEVGDGVNARPRPIIIQFNDPSVKERVLKI